MFSGFGPEYPPIGKLLLPRSSVDFVGVKSTILGNGFRCLGLLVLLCLGPAGAQPAEPPGATPGGELVKTSLGIAITPPPAWVDAAGDSADPTLAFRLHPASGGTLLVRVSPENARSLKGLWAGLRYSVVVDQGASILKDEPAKLGSAQGRQLLYETYSELGSNRHLEVNLLTGRRLIVMLFEAPAPLFEANLSQARAAMGSLRILPTTEPSPQP